MATKRRLSGEKRWSFVLALIILICFIASPLTSTQAVQMLNNLGSYLFHPLNGLTQIVGLVPFFHRLVGYTGQSLRIS